MTRTTVQGKPTHKWKVSVYLVNPDSKVHYLTEEMIHHTQGEARVQKFKLISECDGIHVTIDEVVVYE